MFANNFVGTSRISINSLGEHEWMSGSEIGAADLAIFPLVRQSALATMPQCRPLVLKHERLNTWLKAVDAKTSTEHTAAVV